LMRYCELSRQQIDLCEDLLETLYEHRQELGDGVYVEMCEKVKDFYDGNEFYFYIKEKYSVKVMKNAFDSCSPSTQIYVKRGIVITNINISRLNELRVDLEEGLDIT